MSNEQEVQQLPTIFDYCVQAYQAMVEEASYESLGAAYGDDEGLVYDGYTTKLIAGLGLPTPYYTKVFQELQRMDCARQLRRGGSTTTSRWLLLQEPTPELFTKMPDSPSAKAGYRRGSRLDNLEQRVKDLQEQINRYHPYEEEA